MSFKQLVLLAVFAALIAAHEIRPSLAQTNIDQAELINVFALSADYARIATAHADDGMIRIWDAQTGDILIALQGADVRWSEAEIYLATDLGFSPDGTKLGVSFGGTVARGLIWIIDASTGQLLKEIEAGAYVVAFDWNADGTRIAAITSFGTDALQSSNLSVWDTGSGDLLNQMDLSLASAEAVDWSPDNSTIAYTSNSNINLLNVALWQVDIVLESHEALVNDIAWHPTADRLASTDENTVRIWDTTNGQQLQVLQKTPAEYGIPEIAWDTGGDLVASTSFEIIDVWSVQLGSKVFEVDAGGNIKGLWWRPNGSIVYSSGGLEVVDLADARQPE